MVDASGMQKRVRRQCQRLFYWPSLEPEVQIARRDSYLFSPISQCVGFAIKCYQSHGTPIDRLLFAGRPFAIVGRVIAVIVLSIYSHAFGAFPHVGQEQLEGLPSLANRYSPSAVIGEVRQCGITASRSHPLPCVVSSRRRPSVCSAGLAYRRFPFASATRSVAAFYLLQCQVLDGAAIAFHLHASASIPSPQISNDCQVPVLLTDGRYNALTHLRLTSVSGQSRPGATNTLSARFIVSHPFGLCAGLSVKGRP